MIAAFSKILKRSGHFSTLQTDLGTGFTNKAFQSWLKDHNIRFFHSHNHEIKASIAERFIRTVLLKKNFGVILRMKINENIPM